MVMRFAVFLALASLVPGAQTESGELRGTVANGIESFKGIPYAAPPVGELRWKPPQPPVHWTGAREATKYGDICPQDQSLLRDPASGMSEDCLTLNIWTPSLRGKLPVMVWIHGGGFKRGSSSQPQYDGTNLARHGVVLVSLNYRLGQYGFEKGNFGLLDQIAALRWVGRNIRQFGGDPQSVTIFGESAGAFSVLMLVASPLTHGLFQRVISESGGLDVRQSTTPPNRVVEQTEFRPFVDGTVLPKPPLEIYRAGDQNNVPLLAGTNADEGTLFTKDNPEALRDSLFREPTRAALASMARKNNQTYCYEFERVNGMGRKNKWGAFHSAEIAYVFGNLDVVPLGFGPVKPGTYNEEDRRLSDEMQSAWIRFARTGDPGWPPFPACKSFR
jgi:para-nitrobenzyl esterase